MRVYTNNECILFLSLSNKGRSCLKIKETMLSLFHDSFHKLSNDNKHLSTEGNNEEVHTILKLSPYKINVQECSLLKITFFQMPITQ